TGQERLTLKGHKGSVTALAFTPDGNTLASGSADGTVRLWHAAADAEARTRKTWPDRDDPADPQALNEAADRLWEAGRQDGAEKLIRQALAALQKLAADPSADAGYRRELPLTWFRLGRLLTKDEQSEEATRAREQAGKLQANLPPRDRVMLAQRYAHLGDLLVRLDRREEANAANAQALELDPGNWRHWHRRAGAFARLKQWDKAVADYSKLIELQPPEPSHWHALGVANYRAGDWKAAIAALKREDQLSRGWHFSANAFYIAMAHWQSGEKELARKW